MVMQKYKFNYQNFLWKSANNFRETNTSCIQWQKPRKLYRGQVGIEMKSDKLNKILREYQKDINNVVNEKEVFYLVNAGRMNHGKSSLLNSLIGQSEDYFEVQDRRTTVKNKEYQYDDNIIFVDTPGLNADEHDDREAIKAYKKASLILFVHNLSVGDVRKEEIRDLKTIISCFSDMKSLEEQLVLVLTGKDSITSLEDLSSIKEKILLDIKNEVGLSNFKVFEVSNTTFKKGLENKKKKLQEHSGVLALKLYIEKYIADNRATTRTRAMERIDLLTANVRELIEVDLKKLKSILDKKEKEINTNISKLFRLIDHKVSFIKGINERVDLCNQQIKELSAPEYNSEPWPFLRNIKK